MKLNKNKTKPAKINDKNADISVLFLEIARYN